MLARDSRTRHHPDLWTESLESRRLLAASPLGVISSLPLPGLATGVGMAQTVAAPAPVSVSPASGPSVNVSAPAVMSLPTATGPSTTLSPLANDSETANAPSSEVARPTPGRSDRISSSVLGAIETPPTHHLRSPDAPEVVPGPELQEVPLPAAPLPQPEPKAVPVPPPADPAPAPVPKIIDAVSAQPIDFQIWDAAIEVIASEPTEAATAMPTPHAGSAMAVGALLAAWGGWKHGSKREGSSRRRPMTVAGLEAGPGH